MRLFVYGTLKAGHGLHGCMVGAQFVGEAYAQGFTLFGDGVPFMVPWSRRRVRGELYEIAEWRVKSYLDLLEYAYKREEVSTTCGPAQAYVWHGSVEGCRYIGEEY